MNGHIIGFRPQTQKLQSPFKTPSSTLAVKGFREMKARKNNVKIGGKKGIGVRFKKDGK